MTAGSVGIVQGPRPRCEIRAVYDDATIRVYQAYSPAIAEAALAAGKFVAPFSFSRMTWIKPSFTWMMYRCGWALKPGQEYVLGIDITRAGFEWALGHSCLSHFDSALHADRAAWEADLKESPVRIQWDPERTVDLQPLPWRSLQVGLGPVASRLYVDTWLTGIEDVTPLVRRMEEMLRSGNRVGAEAQLPQERAYPLPEALARRIGMPWASRPITRGMPSTS